MAPPARPRRRALASRPRILILFDQQRRSHGLQSDVAPPLRRPVRAGGFETFLAMQREMNRLFDEMVRGSDVPFTTGQGNGGAATLLASRMDVTETDGAGRQIY